MERKGVVEIKVSNKVVYIFLILAILFFGIVAVQAVVGHSADEINLVSYYTKSEVYTKAEFDALMAPHIP